MKSGSVSKPRIFELSSLNVLLCLLVIFIHVTSRVITDANKASPAYAAVLIPWRLSSFAVQGFIFLSGLKLMLNADKAPFRYFAFLKKRFVSVLLPYLAWVIVYYLYFCRRGWFPFNLTDLPGYLLRGDLVSHFYFVIIIVQFYLLAPVWRVIAKSVSPALLVPAALLLMPPLTSALQSAGFAYTDRVFTTYVFYWAAGCAAGLNYGAFKELLNKNRAFIIAIFSTAAIANAVLSFLRFTSRLTVPWLESVHTLYAASAIIFFLSILPSRPGQTFFAAQLTRFDKVTYAAYLSHVLVIFITDGCLPRIAPAAPAWLMYLMRLVIVYSVVITGTLLWETLKTNLNLFTQTKRRE